MADYLKYFAPITITGQPSSWASIDSSYLVTKANVETYISGNSTTAGGSGNDGKLVKLDANGLIADSMLPALAISNTTVGTTAPAAGSVQTGDVFVNTTENKSYIYTGTEWQELLSPTDAVLSVNGKTGTVTLSASDVSAIATSAKVTSVSSSSTDAQIPSALAVYTFVNTNYSATGHTHTSANITDSISASTGITSSAAGLVQGKAVEAYAAKKSHTHTSADVSDSISASSGIVTGESKLAQAGAVADYVTSAIGAIDYSNTYAAKSHTHVSADITDSISTAAGVTSTETKLVQAKGVQLYVAGQAATWTAGTTTVATTGTKFVTQTYLASAISSLDLVNTYAAKTHSHTATDLPTATSSEKGIASFGTGLSISSGAVTLSAATADALGGVKVGSGNGLAYSSNKITMSLANGTSAGTVKASTGITISSGNISVNFSTDISTDASSDVKAATPKAVKTYVDAQVGGVSAIGTITGNGSAKKFEIAHSLGTSIIVQVVDSEGNTVYVPVNRASGKIVIEFATAPANNTTFSVYITKVGGTAIAATVASA